MIGFNNIDHSSFEEWYIIQIYAPFSRHISAYKGSSQLHNVVAIKWGNYFNRYKQATLINYWPYELMPQALLTWFLLSLNSHIVSVKRGKNIIPNPLHNVVAIKWGNYFNGYKQATLINYWPYELMPQALLTWFLLSLNSHIVSVKRGKNIIPNPLEGCWQHFVAQRGFSCLLLTHWGRVTHICIGNPTIIGSDNGLSPGRRQAIILTNAGILSIGPLGTKFHEISIGIQTFSFKKMHFKMASAKWRPFCLGLNVLTHYSLVKVTVIWIIPIWESQIHFWIHLIDNKSNATINTVSYAHYDLVGKSTLVQEMLCWMGQLAIIWTNVGLLMHFCSTRAQWVNISLPRQRWWQYCRKQLCASSI